MKFNLTYEGSLPSSGNKSKNDDVWRIRKEFHPQLLDLWSSHPALTECDIINSRYPLGGSLFLQGHHQHPGPIIEPYQKRPIAPDEVSPGEIDLNAKIEKFGKKFRPLVRESYALHCGLKILFLRQEAPGRVYQGGDVDGRIKTLLDALTMPQHKEQVFLDPLAPDPIYCLMEDDSMASGFSVESERLLSGVSNGKDYVKLIVEVDVRVRFPTIYNQSLLGT